MFKNFRTEEIREEVIYLPLLDACLRELPPCGTKARERGRVRGRFRKHEKNIH